MKPNPKSQRPHEPEIDRHPRYQDDQPYDTGRTLKAEDVRQGSVILEREWQRLAFVSGLVGLVMIGLLGVMLATA